MRMALMQLSPAHTLEGNLEKGLDACQRAADVGCDIALFPEMWSTGYDLQREALRADSEFTEAFRKEAGRLGMAICITYLEDTGCGKANSLVLFDRHGKKVLSYRKVHTCDFSSEHVLTAGSSFPVADLDTEEGIIRTGCMICYDREAPESARILMLRGSELILTPNACEMEINRLCQLRSRAFENMCAIATCNYPSGSADCNGHSTFFDGMASCDDGTSRDMCLIETGEEEGIFTVEVDISALREYRRRECQGNTFRHPELYSDLVAMRIDEPFHRACHRTTLT